MTPNGNGSMPFSFWGGVAVLGTLWVDEHLHIPSF